MKKISLDGKWNMKGNGFECTGTVPGSVYSFLLENGLMNDPYFGQNESEALEIAEHDYTFSRKFSYKKTSAETLLCCDGYDFL